MATVSMINLPYYITALEFLPGSAAGTTWTTSRSPMSGSRHHEGNFTSAPSCFPLRPLKCAVRGMKLNRHSA